ncbi:MAG: hypothetical protein A2284_14940 [Deltaproteobacteria bacterium RIFOXYA12_FULL_61_11]|nr:MAG: hypothetical protein A2284_14940 [Deltaproteobacteria bacterium RIFOXYA12_FULL_61_11]
MHALALLRQFLLFFSLIVLIGLAAGPACIGDEDQSPTLPGDPIPTEPGDPVTPEPAEPVEPEEPTPTDPVEPKPSEPTPNDPRCLAWKYQRVECIKAPCEPIVTCLECDLGFRPEGAGCAPLMTDPYCQEFVLLDVQCVRYPCNPIAYCKTCMPGYFLGERGCEPTPPSEPTLPERMAILAERIQTLVGDAACANKSDCQSTGYGAKACGGPADYLVYSLRATDSSILLPLVDEYNQLSKTWIESQGLMGDCSVRMPHPVDCLEGHCGETDFDLIY